MVQSILEQIIDMPKFSEILKSGDFFIPFLKANEILAHYKNLERIYWFIKDALKKPFYYNGYI